MASYLRMQAAAAAPAGSGSPGRQGQTAGQEDRQYAGRDQGQLERQPNGQVKSGIPDTGMCFCNKATACSVDVHSVQVSGYSHTLRESGLMAGDSEVLRGGGSQAASRYHSAKVSDVLSRTWPIGPSHG